MTEESDAVSKKAKPSIISILKTVAMLVGIVVFLITVITNLLVVYIIFAPDDFPKPFYVNSYGPGETPQMAAPSSQGEQPAVQNPETGHGAAPTPAGVHGSAPETATKNPSPVGEVMPGEGVLLDTGTKIVNLNEPGGRKFIRTNIVLEFAPNDPRYYQTEVVAESSSGGHGGESTAAVSPREAYVTEFMGELNTKMPIINDIIISLLSTKTFSDVYTSEGKEALRQEIIQAVNSRLHGYQVIYVYFTEFVMQ